MIILKDVPCRAVLIRIYKSSRLATREPIKFKWGYLRRAGMRDPCRRALFTHRTLYATLGLGGAASQL